MKNVAVLMSTYNGNKYLREQIDSILSQEGVEVKLYMRDDGSRDETIEILREYQGKNPEGKIEVIKGENVGVGNSFMDLVYHAGGDHDYYAFADQDDVWQKEKLAVATGMLGDAAGPTLYASNQMLTDQELRATGLRYKEKPDVTYEQILCQNKIAGCTMVWNRELQALLSEEGRRPSAGLLRKRIHDVWVGMVAAVTGEIRYDENAYILYRQHESNVVGVRKENILKQWMAKLKDADQRNGRSSLCQEISERFDDKITDESVKIQIRKYGNYQSSLNNTFKLMRDGRLLPHTGETKMGFAMKVFFHLF